MIMGLLCSELVYSQEDGALGYYQDAVLFGNTSQAGSARMQAIGGAQMSLGGDVSAGNANPAGLGFFRRSAVAFTPSMDVSNSSVNYLGRTTEDFGSKLNVGHFGIVFYKENDFEASTFKGGSFGLSYSRTNYFNNNIYLDAYNGESSIIDSYIDRAAGLDTDQLDGDLFRAYDQYMINPYLDENNNTAYDAFVTGYPRQVERIRSRGKQGQWDFSYGGNHNDMIYFGVSVGVSTVDYELVSTYTESEFELDGTADPAIDYLSTENRLQVNGLGVNTSFGLIFRPSDLFRIGISAETPTFYDLKDESSEDLQTVYNNYTYIDGDESVTLDEFYDKFATFSQYSLVTPWRLSLGGSFFLGKLGFISADLDYLDYSSARIRSTDFNPTEDNLSIGSLYKPAVNVRVGAETRLGNMRFRAGYAHQGDPYADSEIDNSIQRISAGLGYRNKNVFVDGSVVRSSFNSIRTPYTFLDGSGPTAQVENKNVTVSLTIGFNF